MTDLSVRFGETKALERVDLTVRPGELTAVVGGDGAGKSTLLRVLAGLDIGRRGSVSIPAADRIGYVPATGGVYDDLTIMENLSFVAAAYRVVSWQPRARQLLAAAAIDGFEDRLAGQLSGGQRRKLAGCLALLHEPELVVLDELTTGVDPLSRTEIWRLMASAAARGSAIVAATTYLDEAERAVSVTLLHEGRVLAAGAPADIVAGISGSVDDRSEPTNGSLAWRKGRGWRQWDPNGVRSRQLTLEDAAIVLELQAELALTTQGDRP
ncbi:MAG: ABC transporter ATP-binding protein [Acidimicrobiales bacterium]